MKIKFRAHLILLLSICGVGLFSAHVAAFDFLSSPAQLSSSGPAGDADYDSTNPAAAYNSSTSQYLSVWAGDGSSAVSTNEIFGRLVDSSGTAVSEARQYSTMGSDSSADSFDATSPAVVYNSTDNEFLVAWYGDTDKESGLTNNEFEIWVQRVNGDSGVPTGSPVRVTYVTDAGSYDVSGGPSLAYDSTHNQYFIAWIDNAGTGATSCHSPSTDLNGLILDSSLTYLPVRDYGSTDFANAIINIDTSTIGTTPCSSTVSSNHAEPKVVYAPDQDEFLVVFSGDLDVDDAWDIYGVRIAAATGADTSGRLTISNSGGDDEGSADFANYDARYPSVAYNPDENEYLVVWTGDSVSVGDDQTEAFGQYLFRDGTHKNSTFRISESTTTKAVVQAAVAYNTASKEFLTVWSGESTNGQELYGERLDKDGSTIGDSDFTISAVNEATSSSQAVRTVGLATASDSENFLPLWSQTDDTNGLVDGEYEIFGRTLGTATSEEEEIEEPIIETTCEDDGSCSSTSSDPDPALKFHVKADSKQSLKKTGGVFIIKASCNVECLSYGSVRGKGKSAKKKGKAAKLAKKVSKISKIISDATQRVAVYRTVKIRLSNAEQKNLKKVIASKSCKKKGKKRKCTKGSAYLKATLYASDGNTTKTESVKILITK